jgi:hypothetical protein
MAGKVRDVWCRMRHCLPGLSYNAPLSQESSYLPHLLSNSMLRLTAQYPRKVGGLVGNNSRHSRALCDTVNAWRAYALSVDQVPAGRPVRTDTAFRRLYGWSRPEASGVCQFIPLASLFTMVSLARGWGVGAVVGRGQRFVAHMAGKVRNFGVG